MIMHQFPWVIEVIYLSMHGGTGAFLGHRNQQEHLHLNRLELTKT
jgi:hypothetical protein